jgi:hypothetical protein
MALIFPNGRPYLYRSVRQGGQVTSEYVSSGATAIRFARKDAQERAQRDAQRAEMREDCDALDAIESALNDYFDRVEDLACAALYAAGYHRPKRQWRKRRERRQLG